METDYLTLINYAVVITPYLMLVNQPENRARLQRQFLKRNRGVARIIEGAKQAREFVINLDDTSFSIGTRNYSIEAALRQDSEGDFIYYKNGIPFIDYNATDSRPIPHRMGANIDKLVTPEMMQTMKINENNIFRSILMASWSAITENRMVVPIILVIIAGIAIGCYFSYMSLQTATQCVGGINQVLAHLASNATKIY